MRTKIRARSTIAKVGAAVVLFAALGGVAYAADGGPFAASDGSVSGCAPPAGGPVHIWKPGHRCSGGWVSVTFAPAGAAGTAGPAGPTGATGPADTNATTVDGLSVAKVAVKVPTPGSSTSTDTLYSGGGLTILADCDSAGNASLQASGPASADSELTVSGYDSSGTPSFGSQTATLGPSVVTLAPAGSGEATFSYQSSSGQTVTGNIGYQKAPSFGGYAGCGFFGTITAG
jgi:hypothetical protein